MVYFLSAVEAAFNAVVTLDLRSVRVSTRTNNLSNNESSSLCFSGSSCQSSTRGRVKPIPPDRAASAPATCLRFTHVRFRNTADEPWRKRESRMSSACACPPPKNCVWLLLKRHFYISGSGHSGANSFRAEQTAFRLTGSLCSTPNHAGGALAIWLRLKNRTGWRGSGGHLESHP